MKKARKAKLGMLKSLNFNDLIEIESESVTFFID
jgi:hypothetical protein